MPDERGVGGGDASRDRAESEMRDKITILERHVDHLMGQLYHQIDLIRFHKERADHLAVQLEKIDHCPKELDQALKRVSLLREDIAGRKEVEVDLRRRQDVLELEDKKKQRQIERLERELNRIWDSPPHRLWRAIKRPFRAMLGYSSDDKKVDDESS